MPTIYKGDDTDAFGGNLLKINLKNAEGITISKVIFQCGPVQKVFTRPVFPLLIDFDHEESSRLFQESECHLQIFDEKGKRKTVDGTITLTAKPKVVADEQRRRG